MKKFRVAATGAALLGFAAALITLHAQAQSLSFDTLVALGESELNAGMYDQARQDLTQAFQIAKQNRDVGNLLRLTEDFNKILARSNPPTSYVSSYQADVSGAYVTALDAAHYEACYDPTVPGSGANVARGQADLHAVIGLFENLFGTPRPSASGLLGTLSGLELAAQGYLAESLAGDPACRPAPSAMAPGPGPAPAPAPAPSPVSTPGIAPSPAGTPGVAPSPANTSGAAPTPANTSGTRPLL